jgi:hypothetical protein
MPKVRRALSLAPPEGMAHQQDPCPQEQRKEVMYQ